MIHDVIIVCIEYQNTVFIQCPGDNELGLCQFCHSIDAVLTKVVFCDIGNKRRRRKFNWQAPSQHATSGHFEKSHFDLWMSQQGPRTTRT